MKIISLTLLTLTAAFLISCSDASHEKHEHNATETHEHEDNHKDKDHSSNEEADTDKLVLNNGKKWKLSESLMKVAGEMSNSVNDFDKSDNKEYDKLAATLNEGISNLINTCELPDGEAHENLHKWLHPYMEMAKSLKNSENEDNSKAIFEKIKESFNTFNKYFE